LAWVAPREGLSPIVNLGSSQRFSVAVVNKK